MPYNQLGVSFLPSQENQELGPQRGQMEGDLGEAFKILSLRYPRVMGAKAIAPPNILQGGGMDSMLQAKRFNPDAAVLEAMIRAMVAGGGGQSSGGESWPGTPPSGGVPAPHFTPGIEAPSDWEEPPPSVPSYSRDRGDNPILGRIRRR